MAIKLIFFILFSAISDQLSIKSSAAESKFDITMATSRGGRRAQKQEQMALVTMDKSDLEVSGVCDCDSVPCCNNCCVLIN